MTNYKDHLPERVPEFLQGDEDSEFHQYLEACGEIFDEFTDAIKEQDVYKDYKNIPEARLSLLARRFAFDPPNNIPEELLRGIIRDITGIYTTKGVEQSFTWVFRLIGWKSTISYAWLLNPDKYDPMVKVTHSSLFERDGLPNTNSSLTTFFPQLGEGYRIGVSGQPYANNRLFIIDDMLLIGRNTLTSISGENANPFVTPVDRTSVHYNSIDYRNFVYGDAVDTPKGTFFTGSTFFSRVNNVKEAKIVGERYAEENIIKSAPAVISTPYIVIRVDSEDYVKFTRPYVDDTGTFYSYTDREKFKVAQTIIEYLLYEFVRPANVKIILVVSSYEDEDVLEISDTVNLSSTSSPFDPIEAYPIEENESSYVQTYTPRVIGTEHFFVGMTSWVDHSGLMPYTRPIIGETGSRFAIQDTSPKFTYEYLNLPMVAGVGVGEFESEKNIIIRTPSLISIAVAKPAAIFGKEYKTSDWEFIQDLSVGATDIRAYDYTLIKITNYSSDGTILSDGDFDANVTVTWEDKQNIRHVEWDFGLPAVYPVQAV